MKFVLFLASTDLWLASTKTLNVSTNLQPRHKQISKARLLQSILEVISANETSKKDAIAIELRFSLAIEELKTQFVIVNNKQIVMQLCYLIPHPLFTYCRKCTRPRTHGKTKLRNHRWCLLVMNENLESCLRRSHTVIFLSVYVQCDLKSKCRASLLYFQQALTTLSLKK